MKYDVTIMVEGRADFSVIVDAPRESLAETRAMFHYPHPLKGEWVTFWVDAVSRETER